MVGIFDSGLGGLTVVKEIYKQLPGYSTIYFGDTANLPYGTKSEKAVNRYSFAAIEFLRKRGAKVIMVACNTASALAVSDLKKRSKKLPIFDVISPVVESLKKERNAKVGVIGTPSTINSEVYQKRIKKTNPKLKVYATACPLLVPLVEEGLLSGNITRAVLKVYLAPLKEKNINSLILACTHYPLLEKEIRNFMGKKVRIINPAELAVSELKKFLEEKNKGKSTRSPKHQFFVSDKPYKFQTLSKNILGKEINVRLV